MMSTALAVTFTNETVDLFAINAADNQMMHKHRPILPDTASVLDNWLPGPTSWTPLGNVFTSAPVATMRLAPGLTTPGDVHVLDVFGLGTDNRLYQLTRFGADWPPNHPWQPLPGTYERRPAVLSTVHTGAQGQPISRLDSFGLGTDNAMYHLSFANNNWVQNPQDWNLGERLTSSPAGVTVPDRLDVFVVGSNNHMLHKTFDGTTWSPSASWETLGVGVFTSPPAAVNSTDDRVDLFALGTDNQIYHNALEITQSSWSGWRGLGGTFNSPPVAISPDYQRLDVFAVGDDNHIWHKSWNGDGWSEWIQIGNRLFNCTPAVVTWRGQIEVFALGVEDNHVYQASWDYRDRAAPGKAPWIDRGGVFNPEP
jgi:hypothetical protein